jgi:hypothetical protein
MLWHAAYNSIVHAQRHEVLSTVEKQQRLQPTYSHDGLTGKKKKKKKKSKR